MDTRIITSGKRKTAVARAVTSPGSGKITINGKPYETLQVLDRLKIEEPVRIAKSVLRKLDFNIAVNARGGGEKGQVEAARIAISRAILAFTENKDVEKAFKSRKRKEGGKAGGLNENSCPDYFRLDSCRMEIFCLYLHYYKSHIYFNCGKKVQISGRTIRGVE